VNSLGSQKQIIFHVSLDISHFVIFEEMVLGLWSWALDAAFQSSFEDPRPKAKGRFSK
jgi:hypothetical protein